jgi:NADH:ubiquinone oxidoreductase subunit 6 (subunit J)
MGLALPAVLEPFTLSGIFFFLASIGAIGGAIGVVVQRNPFFAVLALVFHLTCLAGLYLLLRAQFVAAAQVVVYAGAVMVLYVFVVAYVGGGETESLGGTSLRILGPLFALALAIELCLTLLGSALRGIDAKGAPFIPGFGSPREIGRLFLTTYLFPFEVASLLLLLAAVGAVVLARRRRGLTPDDEVEARVHGPRPLGTGTMAEGSGLREALAAIQQAGLGPVETRHREGVDLGAPLAAPLAGPDEEGGW